MLHKRYKPAGYCPDCGYAMDPGICPECGCATKSLGKEDCEVDP